jgi:signal transduction histidine kinase
MKSLQLRLSMGLFISLIGVFLALWWLMGSAMRDLSEEATMEHLNHDTQSLLQAIQINIDQPPSIDENLVEPIYKEPKSGSYYQIIINDRVFRSPSLQSHELGVPSLGNGQTNKLYLTGPAQQPLLIMAYGYRKQGHAITIAVAQDLSPALSRIHTFELRYGVIAILLLIILLAIQTILLRHGLLPLTRIQRQIRELDKGDIWQLDTNVPQEVSALVTEVNWLLNALEQRLERSRHSIADLAHALKTPLTVIHQLYLEPVIQAEPDLANALMMQTTNMQRMIDRVLKRARLAGSGAGKLKFTINQEMPGLIKALQRMYRDKHLSIEYYAPKTGTLPIDREDMLELVGNLLDNACKWANSTVRITLTINYVVSIMVEDDGPGVSESDMALLSERGTRLDEAVNGDGIGLSIVRLITEQHNGQLHLRRSANLGGFCVEAILRLA